MVIADDASIDPEMNELYQYMKLYPNIKCYLPESFEWMLLRTGLIDENEIRDILTHPQDFIESQEYFSLEQFFTDILVQYPQSTYLNYNKHR